MNAATRQARAQAQILKAGAVATLEWDQSDPIDNISGAPAVSGTSSTSVAFVAFPLMRRMLGADTYETQSEILMHSRRFDMGALAVNGKSPLSTVPTQGMRILSWEGSTWTIDSISPLIPDGVTPLMYSGTMRR